ncbi:MAG: acyloxyacyl hydrolase [Sulfuricella sp.]|nr:acyloxyacyl hydrolase [Sulfuricella sp.]
MKKKIRSMLIIAMGLAAMPAHALDGAYLLLGRGDETDMVRAGLVWNWQKTWRVSDDWRLTGDWDVSLGYWRMRDGANNGQDIGDIGVTPVFRLQRNAANGIARYVEGAIGIHLLSHTYDGRLGSCFEFGDQVGVGARFGAKQEYDVAYVLQHVSNGGIKQPNHGINFNQIRFAYHF